MENTLPLLIPLFGLAIGMVAVVSKVLVRPLIDAYLTTRLDASSRERVAALEGRVALLEQQVRGAAQDKRAA